MNIAIIGAGRVGQGLAKRLSRRGHRVVLSFARDEAAAERNARTVGATFSAVLDAVRSGEVVVLATTWGSTREALDKVRNWSERRILWDCTNALKTDFSGLDLPGDTSAAEEVARLAPWARVVKAIPPFADLLHEDTPAEEAGGSVFVCSDDAAAKQTVGALLKDIDAEFVDAGPLRNARYAEHAGFLMVQLAYASGYGPRISLRLSGHRKP